MPPRRLARVHAVGLPSHQVKWFVLNTAEGDCGGAICGGSGDPALDKLLGSPLRTTLLHSKNFFVILRFVRSLFVICMPPLRI
jgi:hypothetical protein